MSSKKKRMRKMNEESISEVKNRTWGKVSHKLPKSSLLLHWVNVVA